MAMIHDFVVLDKDEFEYNDWNKVRNKVSYDVSIHDDLIMYFYDFLQWIPAYNPSMKMSHFGLNLYGVTVIRIEGAQIAFDLFQNIINILKLAPSEIELTGSSSVQLADDDVIDPNPEIERIVRNSHKYEKIKYQKFVLIQQLENLKGCFERVIQSKGQLYVMHLGI